MGSDIVLNSLHKICKKELGLGFDNLVKPESLDMHSVINGSVANGGINAKFSNKINNDEFVAGLSMNILCAGDKSPVQSGFFTNRAGDLLPAPGFLGMLYNFCNFVIMFSLM